MQKIERDRFREYENVLLSYRFPMPTLSNFRVGKLVFFVDCSDDGCVRGGCIGSGRLFLIAGVVRMHTLNFDPFFIRI